MGGGRITLGIDGRQTNKQRGGGGGGNYKNDSMEISKQPKPMKPIRSGLPLPRIRVVLARIKKKILGLPDMLIQSSLDKNLCRRRTDIVSIDLLSVEYESRPSMSYT